MLCLEAGPLEKAGAHWFNGVPAWAFESGGVPLPDGPELAARGVPFHLVAGWGPHRVVVRDHDLMEVDMSLLGARLRQLAADHGATLRGGQPVDRSALGEYSCTLVDATGLAGLNLLGLPAVGRDDLCAAAQGHWKVTDLQAAQHFFGENAVAEGDTLCFTGVAGGYSVVNLRLKGETLAMLTGAIPAQGHTSGLQLAKRFAAEHSWVGERLRLGARSIPLAPPPAFIGRGRVAAIGDSARQVFGAHGSGIAQQLLAARLLARVLASGEGPESYDRRWRRRYGGLLAGADLLRRFSCSLDSDQLSTLMRTGALPESMARRTLTQRPARPGKEVLGALVGLARNPSLARRMLPVLARLPLLEARYRLGRR